MQSPHSMAPRFSLITISFTGFIHSHITLAGAFFVVILLWTGFPVCSTVELAQAAPTADEILEIMPLSDDDKQQVLKGDIIKWTTTEAGDRELAVGLILLINAQPERAAELFRGAAGYKLIEAVTAFGAIKGKGTVADFANMVLEPNGEKEAARYLEAQPGDTFNLDSKEISAFQALNTSSKDASGQQQSVEALVRKNLLARTQAYQARGLSGVSPYNRGSDEHRSSGQELLLATEASKVLTKFYPSFSNILLKYPNVAMNGVEESYYWLNINVFDRPLFVLSHRMLFKDGDAYIAADRHFYASQEYNALQAVGGVFPKQDGSLLIYLYRVSTDQVGGFGSSMKHPVSRALMGPYVEELFENIRAQTQK